MTYSIVAQSDDQLSWGVAVASKFLAVGSVVVAAEAGVGAVATQSLLNPAHRRQALTLLALGLDAESVVATLLKTDDRASEIGERQVGVVDRDGNSASHTGTLCWKWAGGTSGPRYAIQGNILAGPRIVEAMEATWRAEADQPFPLRLISAIRAGERAGGDVRGKQSAALYVVSSSQGFRGSDVQVDLRVDDHSNPINELERLYELHDLYWGTPVVESSAVWDAQLEKEIGRLLHVWGYHGANVRASLFEWAEKENLSSRFMEDRVDQKLLGHLASVDESAVRSKQASEAAGRSGNDV